MGRAPRHTRAHHRWAAAGMLAAALSCIACDRAGTAAGVPGAAVRFDVPADRPGAWSVELKDVTVDALPRELRDARDTGAGSDAAPAAAWARVLVVYAVPTAGGTGAGTIDGLPPMAGRYELRGATLRFEPRYPPAAGVTYVARAAGVPEARFTLPADAGAAPTTRVAAIYPTSDRVPANLLKVYIEFSAPMSDGEAERRVHLLDSGGREVIGAFLHVDEELWDASRRRLTVLFDPGRIKRGLRANVEDGTPLEQGRTFRLIVDADWHDGSGRPLAAGAEKRLIVGEPDRTSPDWRRWDLQPPMAGTTRPLTVRFDEPLDRVLLERWFTVVDAAGNPVAGQLTIGPQESSWSYVPAQPWGTGRHQLLVDPRMEDLGANSLTSLFDAELPASDGAAASQAAERPATDTTPVTLPFTPLRAPAHGTS